MSDIVRRLRLQLPRRAHLSCRTIEAEAADEIESMQAEIEALRGDNEMLLTALNAALEVMKLEPAALVARHGMRVADENDQLRALLLKMLNDDDIYAGIGGWHDEIRRTLEAKP